MNLPTDSAHNPYQEVPLDQNQKVRLTLIATGWAGDPSIRIQIRDETGHLRPGPEIPTAQLSQIAVALIALLSHQPQAKT